MSSHYHLEACGRKMELATDIHMNSADLRGSIKGPITIPLSTSDYLTVLSMPQVCF